MSFADVAFWAGGAIAVLLIVCGEIKRLLDSFVEWGVFGPDTPFVGRLVQRSIEHERIKILRILDHAGIGVAERSAIRDAYTGARLLTAGAAGQQSALEPRLLTLLRPCIVQLGEGEFWGKSQQNKHYLDTMGAMRAEGRNQLAEIMYDFLQTLLTSGRIRPFQCILANKDGNPALARKVAEMFLPQSDLVCISCKGEKDKSRIRSSKPGFTPHPLDLEGRYAFLGAKRESVNSVETFRAIVLDDNCAGGSSLCSIVRRVNALVRSDELPFEPVTHVVTLFNIRDSKTQENFEQEGAQLHTLVALDNEDMKYLYECKVHEVGANIEKYKKGFGVERIG